MKKLVNISSRFQGFLAETMPHLRPLKPTALRWILVGVLLQTPACSKLAARRTTTLKALHDESQALTTAVVDTLQLQPSQQRDPFTATALRFAKQDQHLEGLPLQPFDVPALLATLTNPTPNNPSIPSKAETQVAERFAKQDQWLRDDRKNEAHLVDLGTQAEAAHQSRRSFWTKAIAWLTLPTTGLIALLIFCPLALPILGRLLAILVNTLPRFAGFLGIVSIRAFDTLVHGLEKWKTQTLTQAEVPTAANPPPSSGNDASRHLGDSRAQLIQSLHTTLSSKMDASHKALVRTRKT